MIEKKICGLFIAAILLAGPLLGSIPAAFADDDDDKPKLTDLQKECAKEPEDPEDIEEECELLNLIKDLQAKDMQLMDKDTELMDKDTELMDKDMQLMTSIANAKTEIVRLCDNVPFLKTSLSTLSTITFDILTDTNTALNGLNSFLTTLKALSFTIPIADPSFSIPNPELHTKSITVFGVTFKIPTDFHIHSSTKTFNIPDPTITPFGFITTVPTIPTVVFVSIQGTLNSVQDCDPNILNQI